MQSWRRPSTSEGGAGGGGGAAPATTARGSTESETTGTAEHAGDEQGSSGGGGGGNGITETIKSGVGRLKASWGCGGGPRVAVVMAASSVAECAVVYLCNYVCVHVYMYHFHVQGTTAQRPPQPDIKTPPATTSEAAAEQASSAPILQLQPLQLMYELLLRQLIFHALEGPWRL
ncbi:hypothetical protein VOLCADRAFT_89709 [Volvox carteri f. nagariensis]|uniref:Uncharacterized protein n=1 Tax=Volvox carteri f. nagariensis TaxID=3068 RepID=D8TRW0_VOLCA|nr:uncharacterized protein VOLCADRAFT_89709 [Volvox carteri f. nagariensis]EFJ49715.1 hypothetical protein VOLCADRAFT_89709 [Volvox carteri f. nagariensis]|eukprot:XP_002949222.1 hypothetical protein VOLCADRAFT_89709 [Volvox carteri f. nagariensis]